MPNYSGISVMNSIDALLKEDWMTNVIQNQYASERVLTTLIEKSKKNVSGSETVFTMRLGPNTSTGARGEMDDLPDPGRQLTKQVRIPLAYWYTACGFSGQSIAASRNNATALARVVTDEIKTATDDHKRVENAFMYGDGSGALAQITAVDTTNKIITVNRWSSLFQEGRKIETSTSKATKSSGMSSNVIVGVNRSQLKITLASAITGAAVNDYVFLDGSIANVNMGLMGIVDDGTFVSTFQGLSRATYSQLKAKVFANSGTGRNISGTLLRSVLARLREDGARPDLVIGTSFQLKDLTDELESKRRFIDGEKIANAGIEGIEIDPGVKFTYDVDCPAGYCFLMNKKKLTIAEMAPLGFIDKDGKTMVRISGKDAYEATLCHYYNLVALSCFDMARIEDLNENRSGD